MLPSLRFWDLYPDVIICQRVCSDYIALVPLKMMTMTDHSRVELLSALNVVTDCTSFCLDILYHLYELSSVRSHEGGIK